MSNLVYDPKLKEAIDLLLAICKANNNSISIAVSDGEGDECYVAMEGSADDICFLSAQSVFDFCKQTAETENISIESLIKAMHYEFNKYLNVMLKQELKQLDLLNNPIGRA